MNRPFTTLFSLVSVDGKISTGDNDLMDVDKDYPQISGLKEGLSQYYDLELQTDIFSLNTGRVFAKVGINEKMDEPKKVSVCFVVVDSKPHLTKQDAEYLAKKATKFIVVTTNKDHPAYLLKEAYPNVFVYGYEETIDFEDLFLRLKSEQGAERVTIQSGGNLNAVLVRAGLVDRLLIVIAPALIGGANTSSLVDGESLHSPLELAKIKTLELIQVKQLENSYLLLEYKIKN